MENFMVYSCPSIEHDYFVIILNFDLTKAKGGGNINAKISLILTEFEHLPWFVCEYFNNKKLLDKTIRAMR
ncbi:hypothetical protein KHA80_21230 [Anaerobacillus sp. HL2]|nr:hypothetical protein KHA80_21230 [Anaerobacillus sp. HL2]